MKVEKVKVGFLEENCYVISIDDECLVVDPGDEFNKIKKLVENRNVLAILITHYHFDHVGALEDCINFYDSPVVDFKSAKKQNIGKFKFEIIDTKGHKDDAVTYYFKNENIMFVGDFIFKGTVGRCDLEGGNFKEMIKSIEKIKKYGDNIKIFPGHGEVTTLKEEKENNSYLKGDLYE